MRKLIFSSLLLAGLSLSCHKEYKDCLTCGCEDTGQPEGTLQADSLLIFAPNVFSPNKDSRNDLFIPIFNPGYTSSILFRITDLKEKDEYYRVDSFKAWNGKDKSGRELGSRIFKWHLNITTKWGKELACSGKVFLYREDCYEGSQKNKCRFSDQVDPKHGFVFPTAEPACP